MLRYSGSDMEDDTIDVAPVADVVGASDPMQNILDQYQSAYKATGGPALEEQKAALEGKKDATQSKQEEADIAAQKALAASQEKEMKDQLAGDAQRPTGENINPPTAEPLTMKDVQANIFPLLLMATIAGKGQRRHAVGAMSAFGAMLKGAEEGKKEAYDDAKKNYDLAMGKLKEQQAAYDKRLKQILDNDKLDYTQKLNATKQLDLEYGHQINDEERQIQGLNGRIDHAGMLAQNMVRIEQSSQTAKEKLDAQAKKHAEEIANLDPGITAMLARGVPANVAIPGFSTSASHLRIAYQTEAISQIMKENPGMDRAQAGEELARRGVGFKSGASSTMQLTKMLGATEQAVDQLDYNADKVKEEMRKLGSSNLSPVVNALARGEEKWTGDPAYSSLFFYMHATAMESARILQGGQASVAQLHQGAAEEAQKWASINMTPESFDAVAKAIHDEGHKRLQTYQDAISKMNPNAGTPGQPNQPGQVLRFDAQGNPIQ